MIIMGGGGVRTPCPPLWIRTWTIKNIKENLFVKSILYVVILSSNQTTVSKFQVVVKFILQSEAGLTIEFVCLFVCFDTLNPSQHF